MEPRSRERNRRDWRLAAILFATGGIGAVPADAMHQPAFAPTIYLLPLLALISGAVCWVLADRLSGRWIPLMIVIATLEVAMTVEFAGSVFAIYYTFIAFFAAFVLSDRRAIAFQVVFASLAALAPIAYEPETTRDTLIQASALIPTLVIAAGSLTYLREQLEASEAGYRRLSESDPLTGVGNYRILTERLPSELARHRRYDHELALILIDLDDFKRINDEGGHLHGDRVLMQVAGAMLNTVRAHDTVVRHGGDEFAVIAPETGRPEAEALATRLRDAIARISAVDRPMGSCSGCAIAPSEATDLSELLARADSELRARKEGKPGRARLRA